MGYELSVAVGYRDIFDDYDFVNFDELVYGIPTRNSLQILGYFMAQLHSREHEDFIQLELLKMWIGRLPVEIQEKLFQFRRKLSKNSKVSFLDNVSLLILVEKLLERNNNLEIILELTPHQELNLFKAYLICTQEWIDKQYPNFKVEKITKEEDVISVLLPSQLPYQEVQELKDFRIQFIKAKYFFEFCESHNEFRSYLKIFLDEYNLDSWQKYLQNLLTLYIRKFEELKTPSVINVPEEYPEVISFLTELSVDPNNYQSKLDFYNLRDKPIFKIDETNFLFLNLNFLVDKIYQGIQFDFAKVLLKNKATYNGKAIKSTGDFMSIFGNEFSENGLFYSVMDFAFEKTKYFRLRGEEMKYYINAEPDYYIRDKAKVYIFEFKNVYLNSNVKNSYDLNQIREELFLKYVENQQGKPKGVSQLVNTIKLIRNGSFEVFDSFDYKNAIIYPIIVYVDFSLNLAGINFLLNKEFMSRLEGEGLFKNTKKVVLIDLDSFIKFQDLFREGILKLNNCLNDYIDSLSNRDIFDRIGTFNSLIHAKTNKIGYDSPKMLMEEIEKIFPNLK